MKTTAFIAVLFALIATGAPTSAQTRHTAPAKVAAKPLPKAPPVWFDFKGAKLGMTLEEWKALVPPIENLAGSTSKSFNQEPVRAWCNTERLPNGNEVSGFYQSDIERALGVISCKYASLWTVGTYTTLQSSSIKIGSYSTDDVEYKFLDGILYQINVTGNKALLSDVLDGLTTKFGPPTKSVDDTTQNKAGSTFPHMERSWLNSVASIHLEAPYSKIDNLNVTYMTLDSANRIFAKEKELHPAADKM